MATQERPDKSDLVRFLLEKEGRVMLCLDATRKGVDVPRRFASDQGLRLVLNNRMPQPIFIGEEGIESELRFSGAPHYCVMPYSAIWGAFNPDSGHGCFWPADMPPEIRQEFDTSGLEAQIPSGLRLQEGSSHKAPATPVRPSGKPKLQVVARSDDEDLVTAPPPESPPPRKTHLRLIK